MASVPASVCISLLAYTWTRHSAFPCANNFPMVEMLVVQYKLFIVSNMLKIEDIFMNNTTYAMFIISYRDILKNV